MSPISHALDRVEVKFDDPNLVANAGLVLVGTQVVRLELECLIDSMVRLTDRVGGALPGRHLARRASRPWPVAVPKHRWPEDPRSPAG